MTQTSIQNIKRAWERVFEFDSPEEKTEHDATIISARFLSEVERITEEREITRRQLAKMIGTSPSYITQLYRGDKLLNLKTAAKLQEALNISFQVTVNTH